MKTNSSDTPLIEAWRTTGPEKISVELTFWYAIKRITSPGQGATRCGVSNEIVPVDLTAVGTKAG